MFVTTVHSNQERVTKKERDYEERQERSAGKEKQREMRTSATCSHREMTPGHPEASGLSGCKQRTHLMTAAGSESNFLFIYFFRIRSGNENVLKTHIRLESLLDEMTQGN